MTDGMTGETWAGLKLQVDEKLAAIGGLSFA